MLYKMAQLCVVKALSSELAVENFTQIYQSISNSL